MPNNSSTGGPLLPSVPSPPLEGAALNNFVQAWLVAVSGLPAKMVRPSFQPEPPIVPDAGTVWMAFRYTSRKADTFPYVKHVSGANGSDQLQRQEEIGVLTSFYDLGTDGLADQYAAQFRDGAAIAQNLEALRLGGFALGYVEDMTAVPTLDQQRWRYRVDLPFVLRRQIDRTYAIENLLSLHGTVYTDDGLPPAPVDVEET